MSPTRDSKLSRGARRTALIGAAIALVMTGAAFAAVPLYKRFCQVTGFDGTVRRAVSKPTVVLDKTVTVRFDANVRDLPWDFTPDQVSQTIKIGSTGLAFFHVTNHGDTPLTGHATYNVVPEGAGAYFEKLQCFCFTDQTLKAGQTMDFPVVYFVDPRYASDREVKDFPSITLSYTFFPVKAVNDARAAQAAASAAAKPIASAAPAPKGEINGRAPLGGSPRAAL